jgi:hypothetical protein
VSKPKGQHGGKRDGAGRKLGTKNTLGYGDVKAVKAAGLRVPVSATEEQRELADECLGKMADVMRGKVHYLHATSSLKAATVIREEICGPQKQKVEHSFPDMTDEQLEARYRALVAKAAEPEGEAQ